MLVDFGVGSLSGALPVTGEGQAPGTFEFRSPESWRFIQKNSGKRARYRYGPADELWALGVTFYWLLTDLLPFGERFEGNLEERIISHTPKAPHLVNARVPVALSDICMKMLEKRPRDRYASVAEFRAALKAAMDGAEADGSWDLPLMDPSAPERLRTEQEPAMADGAIAPWLHMWRKESGRRGQKPAEKAAPPAPVVGSPASPVEPMASPPSVEEAPAAEALGEKAPPRPSPWSPIPRLGSARSGSSAARAPWTPTEPS
jgi:eukaryotic-like serine/threonine-protein kinase